MVISVRYTQYQNICSPIVVNLSEKFNVCIAVLQNARLPIFSTLSKPITLDKAKPSENAASFISLTVGGIITEINSFVPSTF